MSSTIDALNEFGVFQTLLTGTEDAPDGGEDDEDTNREEDSKVVNG